MAPPNKSDGRSLITHPHSSAPICQDERSFYYGSMPKVSQEHLERRRQQILDAAVDCFATRGFHATSMQDIFKAAGLSAGAVYRYFPSKAALIRDIAAGVLADTLTLLDDAIDSEATPADVVTSIV